ncbi:MAG: hypothetical protein ABIR17_12245 [Pseudolysinimonas sp.]|uniref:hypothetical protein n=1 Tax=Pseudolysinimonas sp. TaxID=2680009 RepID=UPI00326608F6
MELAYVTVVGLGIGLLLRYLLPGRRMHGVALIPAIGAIVAALLWTGFTWLGFKAGEPWIWVITFAGTVGITLVVDVIVSRIRMAEDARERHVLSGGRA